MKKTKRDKHIHDEKTCFRCRLHELYEELGPTTDVDFILMSLGEAVGQLLSQKDDMSKMRFILFLMNQINESQEEMQDEADYAVKH
jgi:hypothetical protein